MAFKNQLKAVILLPVALLIGAAMVPEALDQWNAADTSSWDPMQVTVFVIVPVVALVAILLAFIRPALDKF